MAIGSTIKNLVLDEIVISLLSKEVRLKDFESINESLVIHGILKDKNRNREKGISKSYGRPKSLRKFKEKCWDCNRVGNLRRDCKQEKRKNKKEKNDYED